MAATCGVVASITVLVMVPLLLFGTGTLFISNSPQYGLPIIFLGGDDVCDNALSRLDYYLDYYRLQRNQEKLANYSDILEKCQAIANAKNYQGVTICRQKQIPEQTTSTQH